MILSYLNYLNIIFSIIFKITSFKSIEKLSHTALYVACVSTNFARLTNEIKIY
jgi:hypothetical protein